VEPPSPEHPEPSSWHDAGPLSGGQHTVALGVQRPLPGNTVTVSGE
jgi:hypothetical protein